eukprot:TRINITY_DN3318_c0_g1_i1.p1 TRINITY_DN3318_c0_g1~~TRINITY_DN3318_c0_g1_i1.p1  ORF type:complete len:786 (-),score=147.62 TRINITY_DN3318_c0_g1_i1:224-2581(-)
MSVVGRVGDILLVYDYACKILKHKLFKMSGWCTVSSSFLFAKAYKDWLLDEKGLAIRIVPASKLRKDRNDDVDSVIYLNPARLVASTSNSRSKSKNANTVGKSRNNVILRKSDCRASLLVAGAPLEGVPRGEIWCTYLCAHNINTFFNNTTSDTGQSKYFLTNSKEVVRGVEPVLASQCHIQVFKTPAIREIPEDIVPGLLAAFLCLQQERGCSYVHGQVATILTKSLKCKEVLHLVDDYEIYVSLHFPETSSGRNPGKQFCIDPDVTRVTQSYCINSRLPRNLGSVSPFAETVFKKLMHLAESNFQLDIKRAVRVDVLLCGEAGSGREKFLRYLSSNLGLNYIETSCQDLLADTAAIIESNLAKWVSALNSSMPALCNLKNIDTLVLDREGKLDLRVITALESSLAQLSPKVLVVGTSVSADKVPARLYRLFMDLFELPATLKLDERKDIIRSHVQEENLHLESDSLIEWISSSTPGCSFADLSTLLNSSQMECTLRKSSVINQQDLTACLAKLKQSKSKTLGLAEVPNVRWEDIGGLEDVKAEILEAVSNIGTAGSKRCGLLLYGPPGVGKTLLAKAAATQCAMSFISVKGPELLNMYVGQSEENVRAIFKRAKEAEPCIVFFDELDSVAPARGQTGDSGGVMDRVVSALLAELDALDQIEVIVIGATNRPDLLDPALMRPGRFDKSILIGTATDPEQQLSILKSQTRKLRLAPDCDLNLVVSRLPLEISGAQLSGIVSNAALRAVERCILALQAKARTNEGEPEGEMVKMEDFLAAVQEFKQ